MCYPRLKNIIKGYKNHKNEKIEGYGGALRYFKTKNIDGRSTDHNKKIMVDKLTELLCLKENCFELIMIKKYFSIYKNSEKYLGIIYHYDGIKPFNKEIEKNNKKINTYVFSLSDIVEEDDFINVNHLVNLKPIPYAILKIYKTIFNYV